MKLPMKLPMKQGLWEIMNAEVKQQASAEPILTSYLHTTILKHFNLENALSFLLAERLDSTTVPAMMLREVIEEALASDEKIARSIMADLIAVKERDPAVTHFSTAFLYSKGFQSIQAHRIAHWLWLQNRKPLALFIQSRVSSVFSVDIHPAARIGSGILIDHGTGIVIGETSTVGNNVSIMQSVTLGGTGKECGDRHPKVKNGVLISAGAIILGNVIIGEGAKIGAGSVVLMDVPAHTTVAGVPAKIVGKPRSEQPALGMDHNIINGDGNFNA